MSPDRKTSAADAHCVIDQFVLMEARLHREYPGEGGYLGGRSRNSIDRGNRNSPEAHG